MQGARYSATLRSVQSPPVMPAKPVPAGFKRGSGHPVTPMADWRQIKRIYGWFQMGAALAADTHRHPRMFLAGVQGCEIIRIPARSMRE